MSLERPVIVGVTLFGGALIALLATDLSPTRAVILAGAIGLMTFAVSLFLGVIIARWPGRG